jgi:hypothetical protein
MAEGIASVLLFFDHGGPMLERIRTLVSSFLSRPRRAALPTRPTLEQLEDRSLPSANLMQPMGMMMGTPMMGTPMMSMSMTATSSMNNGPSAAARAAFTQLVTDFQKSLQQVLSSQTRQQFMANEAAMIQLVFMDFERLEMLLSPMGRTR